MAGKSSRDSAVLAGRTLEGDGELKAAPSEMGDGRMIFHTMLVQHDNPAGCDRGGCRTVLAMAPILSLTSLSSHPRPLMRASADNTRGAPHRRHCRVGRPNLEHNPVGGTPSAPHTDDNRDLWVTFYSACFMERRQLGAASFAVHRTELNRSGCSDARSGDLWN